MEKVYGSYFDIDRLYEELYSKHFKTHYNGKSTKRYLRLIEQINKAERFTDSDIERMFR
jgi:hypothetical protein